MVVENAFGRLKGRWRILRKTCENDLSLVPTIVMACVILHNICENRFENYDQNLNVPNDQERQQPIRIPYNRAGSAEAHNIRNALRDYFS